MISRVAPSVLGHNNNNNNRSLCLTGSNRLVVWSMRNSQSVGHESGWVKHKVQFTIEISCVVWSENKCYCTQRKTDGCGTLCSRINWCINCIVARALNWWLVLKCSLNRTIFKSATATKSGLHHFRLLTKRTPKAKGEMLPALKLKRCTAFFATAVAD